MEENQKYWLLRIEQTIYGPFDTQKVVDLITKGRVSEIDEAAKPRDRWYYVRDLQEFMGAIELQRKITNRKKSHDETTAGTATKSLSEIVDEQTKTIENVDITNTISISDISRGELKTIGNSDRVRQASSPSKKPQSKLKVAFALVAIVAGLSFVFKDKLLKVINDGSMVLTSEKPLEAWSYGDFEKSYELFKQRESAQVEHPLKYAALILKNTKNSKTSRHWLNRVSPSEKKNNAWINLNALAYLYENNFKEAETFLKSIDRSKGELSLESLYNLAVWHHLQEDWSESRVLFESIFAQKKQNELDGSVLYMIDAWIQSLEKINADANEYLKISSFINNVINSESLYRYDVAFLAFWLIQNSRVTLKTFPNLEEKFMSFDPEIVFNRVSSPYVYDFSGKRIKDYCASLVDVNKFIQLSCQMTALRGDLGSMRLLEKPSGNSNQLALFSFIFDKRGESFKANEFLIDSFEQRDGKISPLRFYVQARFCQVNGNYKCAANNWTRALDLNAFSPTALVGLSEAYLEIDEIRKAEDFYKKSMQFSQNLVSYHKLRRRMQDK